MYTFSSKLKTFSLVLMAFGLLGIGYGFYTAPKNIQDVEKLLAVAGHGEAKHEGSAEAKPSHGDQAKHSELAEVDEAIGSHEEVQHPQQPLRENQ